MVRKVNSLVIRLVVLSIIIPSTISLGQEIDAWELGIEYPNEDASNPFEISKDGKVKVEFFVDNSGFVEITVEFAYEIPFGGEADGPEGETVPAGSNESFELEISGIDVFDFEARKTEAFSITATVTARQGVPDPLNPQQKKEGDLLIPTIYDMRIEVSDPVGPMNAGSDTILRVMVTNTGNVQDKVGDVQITDDCPLLTTDNGLDGLMVGSIAPGNTAEADLRATASESHPRRHCDITVTVSSNGAMNTGGSVVVSDEARVSVEPPQKEAEDDGSSNQNDDPVESVKSNLPSPGGFATMLTMVIASAVFSPRKKYWS
ncbi:MAG TPA: hypothetical protein QF641_01115 [Candidatus Thalassarchaeaceae archaeon]|nr:hypothetical protein [Candidatus Thalassarchaeaceae archaeon]